LILVTNVHENERNSRVGSGWFDMSMDERRGVGTTQEKPDIPWHFLVGGNASELWSEPKKLD
jgi:hypothetical protein